MVAIGLSAYGVWILVTVLLIETVFFMCVYTCIHARIRAYAGCCSTHGSSRDTSGTAGRCWQGCTHPCPWGPQPAPDSPEQRPDLRRGQRSLGQASRNDICHPACPHRTLGESRLSAWGDAFGQNDPQFSPLMPYWQHSSGFKPFCTNKPTSFQHPQAFHNYMKW